MNDSIRIILIRGFVALLLCFGVTTSYADIQSPAFDVSSMVFDVGNFNDIQIPTFDIPLSPIEQIQHDTEQFIADLDSGWHKTAQVVDYTWYSYNVNLKNETTCLAQNIYYEARGEDMAGQLAVALVTINRVKMVDYPPTVCQVVYQPGQFSWTRYHKRWYHPHDKERWAEALTIAKEVLYQGRLDNIEDITNGAILFHATYIHPTKWKKYYVKTVQIGEHIFFKARKEFESRTDPVVLAQNTAI